MLLAVYWLAVPAWAADAIEVRVGAAHFPPYTVRPEQGADTGLLPQLIDALNRMQQAYHFVLVPTSIQRRFGDFQQGRTMGLAADCPPERGHGPGRRRSVCRPQKPRQRTALF
jgi:hypothetical protein